MFRASRALAGVVVVIAIAWAAQPASAATITVFSNDFPGWSAAAGGPVRLEDFSDSILVPNLSITFGTNLPGSISGGVWHDRATFTPGDNPVVSFGGGATAFGANWDTAGPGGPGTGIFLFVTFEDGSTQNVAVPIPDSFTGNFFGIVSDMTIRSIRLDADGLGGNFETFDADNVRFVEVPEPTSLALCGLMGAGFLGYRLRRRAKVVVA